jgi:hypothetical protein
MRQIGLQMTMYLNDKDGFPEYTRGQGIIVSGIRVGETDAPWTKNPTVPAERYTIADQQPGPRHMYSWMDAIFPYGKTLNIFTCPSHLGTVPVDLAKANPPYNGDPERYASIIGGDGTAIYWPPSLGYNVYISGFLYNTYGAPNKPAKMANVATPATKVVFVHNLDQYGFNLPSGYGRNAREIGFKPNVYNSGPCGGSPTSYGPCCGGPTKASQYPSFPHTDGTIIIFADGHAKWYSRVTMAGKITCGLVCDTFPWTYPPDPLGVAGMSDAKCPYWEPSLPNNSG